MTGQFGTAYVDGSFATLEFQADAATGTDYRLLSVQGVDITSGTDVQTSFTAEAIDNDGDTAEAVVEVTFDRSEEHTSELQSLMRISYAVFCLKKKNNKMISQI